MELTDPCNADTDGDTIPDNLDPLPTNPGGTQNFIAQDLRSLSDFIETVSLSTMIAPNNNAAKGRRNAMGNKIHAAANAIDAADYQDAVDQLNSLLQKLDGQPKPSDWMVAGTTEISTIVGWIQNDLALLQYLL